MVLKYNKTTIDNSPLDIIVKFETFYKQKKIVFQYSKYINGEIGLAKTEWRENNEIHDITTLQKEIKKSIQTLKPREELALHSIIKEEGVIKHLPMIDFGQITHVELFDSISKLQEIHDCDVYIFTSGRSYHGYMDTLLNIEEWNNFLGDLLLLNRGKSIVVDYRWIGHSLKQGFSSLRLSKNTPLYLDFPKFWEKIPKSKHSNNLNQANRRYHLLDNFIYIFKSKISHFLWSLKHLNLHK